MTASRCPTCHRASPLLAEAEYDWYAAVARVGTLTGREREVLVLLAAGCSNREIAHRLVLAERTVKFYLVHIMAKLGVHSRLRAGLVAFAYRLSEPGVSLDPIEMEDLRARSD